ncbi:MAG: hypothetical protein HC867_01050 [Bacteroidia bacterium]|nr:hypothetical protein [Bacteroidia bacterium]
MFWLFLKPKNGINPILFDFKNIDSIQIYQSGKTKMLIDSKVLKKISSQLKIASLINPDRMNINTDFVDLFFFTNRRKKTYSIRILYNKFHGPVISAGDLYYKNDSLNILVAEYLQKD